MVKYAIEFVDEHKRSSAQLNETHLLMYNKLFLLPRTKVSAELAFQDAPNNTQAKLFQLVTAQVACANVISAHN